MAGGRFTVGDELPQLAELTTGERQREKAIAFALDVLIEMGFDRARYWDLAHDFPGERNVVVLVAQRPEEGSEELFGKLFDYTTSTLDSTGSNLMPVIGEPAEDPADDPDWVEPLGLREKVWVEIPVVAAGRRLGVLAGDWNGKASDLDEGDLRALRMVGTQLGSHLGLKPIMMLRNYRDREEDPGQSPEQLVFDSARSLGEKLDVAVTAVFAFSWPHQTLTKVYEHVASPFEGRRDQMDWLDESYAAGVYLTGKAWDEAAVRHVVSFESLDKRGKNLVAPKSRAWHSKLLGGVRSVMYTFVGELDRRYLIRFINRAERPELPFLGEHSLLDAVVPDFRADVDAAIAVQRSENFEQMAWLTAQVTDLKELVGHVTKALKAEVVDHFAVVCHQQEGAQFGFSAFRGGDLSGEPVPREWEWEEDSLYIQAVQSQKHAVRRLGNYKAGLAARFRDAGFRSVLTLPLATGQTRGVFFVPMRAAARGRSGQLPADCTFGTVNLLHAYSRLIANSVEINHSQAQATGARRALGSLGHELRTPLAVLQSETELSLNTAKRTLRELPIEPKDRVKMLRRIVQREEEMSERWQELDAALRLSPIVARESENKLQVHFSRSRIVRVVERAVEEIEHALRNQIDREGRRYEFNIAESCENLGSVVCDRIYLRHVIRNLLQNAVNYSLPVERRKPGQRPEPMVIDIFGERQEAWVGIKVRNWGWGVPEERRDIIFEPWVRGDISDSRKAIRGMGLGLFLARRIVSAHEGRIVLYSDPSSHATPQRRSKNEGYETTFEVRIPRELEPGTYIHEWVDNRPQPLSRVVVGA